MQMSTDALERKFVPLNIKSTADGSIEGYASVFNEVDQGGDRIMPGAFSASLSDMRQAGRSVKMLWQHDPHEPIGIWDEVAEDDAGLHVKGRILSGVAKGAEAISLISVGAIDGMSIGYRTVKSEKASDSVRVLKELELWEVSLVTFPMQHSARINAVKAAAMTRIDIERKLTQDAKFTRSVARAFMDGGLDAIKAMHDAGDGIDELATLLKARRNIGHAKG